MKNLAKIFPVLLIAVYAGCGAQSSSDKELCEVASRNLEETNLELYYYSITPSTISFMGP